MAWVLSPAAFNDLDAILAYIEQEAGPDAADHVLDDFEAAFDMLSSSPRIGRLREPDAGACIRWWLVHRHIVFYDGEADPLRIVRILHGARDIEVLLKPD